MKVMKAYNDDGPVTQSPIYVIGFHPEDFKRMQRGDICISDCEVAIPAGTRVMLMIAESHEDMSAGLTDAGIMVSQIIDERE